MTAPQPERFDADQSLVRKLLSEQLPHLATAPLVRFGEGWDNTLFRLGDDLIVRLPRRESAATLIAHEQRWLSLLASRLPLPIPVPVHHGRSGCGFPWPWSVVPFFAGEPALAGTSLDLADAATVLGRFLRDLHQPAPASHPPNPWRGIPLAHRTERLLTDLQQLDGLVESTGVLSVWEEVLDVPAWPHPPVWLHGDLHPGNLLVSGGRLSAVIDFGDLTAGDPATDFAVMWMLFPPSLHQRCLTHAGHYVDTNTVKRARGWALALGLAYLAGSRARNDPTMAALGKSMVDAVLVRHPHHQG